MKNKNSKTKQGTSSYQAGQKTFKLDDYRQDRGRRKTTTPPKSRHTPSNPYRNHHQQQTTYSSTPYGRGERYQETSRVNDTSTPEQMRQTIKEKNKLSRKDILNQKKKKRKLFIRKMTTMAILTSILVYGSIKMYDMFKYPSISYQTVQQGMIDNSKERQGVIVREEEVVLGKKEGDIHYIVGEGEKVAKNGDVCFIANDAEVEATLNAIAKVDKNLYSVQDKRSETSYFQSEIHHLNKAIQEEMKRFYGNRYWEQPRTVNSLRKELEKVIQSRTSIFVDDESVVTEELQVNREKLQNQLKNYHYTVTASQAGVISYIIDGYEEIGFDTVQAVTYDTYKKAINHSKDLQVTTNDKSVVEQPLYKIIQSKEWGIITYLEVEESGAFEVGKSYPIYFPDIMDEPIIFKLTEMIQEEKGVKSIWKTDEKISDFLSQRHVKFLIGQNKEEGLKIPLSAIVERNLIAIPKEYVVEDGRTFTVLKQTEVGDMLIPINVQFTDDTHMYVLQEIDNVNTIQLGQTIKTNEKNESYQLKDIETVQGVYVINGAYAKFKRIEVVLQNEAYAILRDNEKTTVKRGDQIISNPKNIKEDQLLKYMEVQNK